MELNVSSSADLSSPMRHQQAAAVHEGHLAAKEPGLQLGAACRVKDALAVALLFACVWIPNFAHVHWLMVIYYSAPVAAGYVLLTRERVIGQPLRHLWPLPFVLLLPSLLVAGPRYGQTLYTIVRYLSFFLAWLWPFALLNLNISDRAIRMLFVALVAWCTYRAFVGILVQIGALTYDQAYALDFYFIRRRETVQHVVRGGVLQAPVTFRWSFLLAMPYLLSYTVCSKQSVSKRVFTGVLTVLFLYHLAFVIQGRSVRIVALLQLVILFFISGAPRRWKLAGVMTSCIVIAFIPWQQTFWYAELQEALAPTGTGTARLYGLRFMAEEFAATWGLGVGPALLGEGPRCATANITYWVGDLGALGHVFRWGVLGALFLYGYLCVLLRGLLQTTRAGVCRLRAERYTAFAFLASIAVYPIYNWTLSATSAHLSAVVIYLAYRCSLPYIRQSAVAPPGHERS